jgi:hypothetical protein
VRDATGEPVVELRRTIRVSIRETTSVVRGGCLWPRVSLLSLYDWRLFSLSARGSCLCAPRDNPQGSSAVCSARFSILLILSYLSIYLSVRMGTGICPSGLLLKLLGFRPLSCVSSCLVRGEHTHTGCRCSRPRRRPRRRAARARRAGGRTSPRRPSVVRNGLTGTELGAQTISIYLSLSISISI